MLIPLLSAILEDSVQVFTETAGQVYIEWQGSHNMLPLRFCGICYVELLRA